MHENKKKNSRNLLRKVYYKLTEQNIFFYYFLSLLSFTVLQNTAVDVTNEKRKEH